MAEPSAAVKKTVSEVLKILEKSTGKVHALTGEPPLDHAVYLILRDRWDYRKAQKALHVLQEEFVDWNEVRATTSGELVSLLRPLGDKDAEVKVEKIRTLRPQLVTLDVMLPKMSGLEALATIRARTEWSALPVIVISGHATVAEAVGAVQQGATDFLEKPLDGEDLIEAVTHSDSV